MQALRLRPFGPTPDDAERGSKRNPRAFSAFQRILARVSRSP
jgi:hypothetical protein